jgi:phosphotransferase system HPr (HPr) family protein
MTEHNEPTRNKDLKEDARLTVTLRLGDPTGLHCRVAALLAYRLRVETPDAEVTLHSLEGRLADPKMPLQTINLGARHSGMVEVEASGDDAAKAMEIIRSLVEREALSREEVIEAIPEDVKGEIGEIRTRQQRRIQEERDKADVQRWMSPGGWIYELAGPEQLGYGSDEPEDEEV